MVPLAGHQPRHRVDRAQMELLGHGALAQREHAVLKSCCARSLSNAASW
jgi:hypothetical protein